MDDLTQEFLLESTEGLDRMERCLTALERQPDDKALLSEIFRAVHTIKGTTGFLAFPRLEKISHAGENLLGLLREGTVRASRPCIDGLLALLDGLRGILREIERTGSEGSGDAEADGALLERLRALRAGEDAATGAKAVQVGASRTSTEATDAATEVVAAQTLQDATLRVDVATLNQMLNLVGELVLTRNQIALHTTDETAVRNARRLDTVTTDLRETMMRARTQPVEQLFGRLPRMVRDLAERLGRCVRLEMTGQDTRLDKTLLDALRDPLLHVLRNAVDHGIEPPAERVRLGKALEARLKVAAYQESGQVVIEVSDDGGGIDPAHVKRRALAKGLITQAECDTMSDAAASQLVFLPGFSTRDEVSVTSGRGVGMDVVRTNVEGVGGAIELESAPGAGTTVRMRVPLTLAIVPALVVRSGGSNFAFPRAEICELMLIMRQQEQALVQRMGDALLLRVRERLVPLVSLSEMLGLARDDARGYYVMLLSVGGQAGGGEQFGVMVDDLDDQQEIVVKPLSPVLAANGLFSGASVLGNGQLAFIVDTARLAAMAKVHRKDGQAAVQREERASLVESSVRDTEGAPQMLAYQALDGERIAMPLTEVERIEKFPVEVVEFCKGRALVQHSAGMVELTGMRAGGATGAGVSGVLSVIVCRAEKEHGLRRGIVVEKVLDISAAETVSATEPDLALLRGCVVSMQPNAAAREWKEAA